MDDNGVLQVGGCLQRTTLEFGEKHPVLMSKKNHVADLLTSHYHRQVQHLGHQTTHGAILRCNRGTNFIGGKSELGDTLIEMDQHKVTGYVNDHGCEWIFNPLHASHFGGAWERQIGTIRCILDAMFAELGSHQLTHKLLVTLMVEVTAIVNAQPISAIPRDRDEPQQLSPSMLLTMKTRPLGPPPGNFVPPDVYARRRWRRVQYLAGQFWLGWRREHLQGMQARSKWEKPKRNRRTGDVV